MIAVLFGAAYFLTLIWWSARECGAACAAGGAVAGFLEWYVFPYSLAWVLIPYVHERWISDVLVFAIGAASCLMLYKVLPPRLDAKQAVLVLVGSGLLSIALLPAYLLAFFAHYGK